MRLPWGFRCQKKSIKFDLYYKIIAFSSIVDENLIQITSFCNYKSGGFFIMEV